MKSTRSIIVFTVLVVTITMLVYITNLLLEWNRALGLILLLFLVLCLAIQIIFLSRYMNIYASIASLLNVETKYYLRQEIKRRGMNRFDLIMSPSLKINIEESRHKNIWKSTRSMVADGKKLHDRIREIIDDINAIKLHPETRSHITNFLVHGRFKEAITFLDEAKEGKQAGRAQTYN